MNFLRKDQSRFKLYKSKRRVDSEGDVTRDYGEDADIFWGHMQPTGSDRTFETAGVFENGRYVLYTNSRLGFSTFDMIGGENGEYLVRAVERRKSYTALQITDSLNNEEGV